eukprot:4571337-Amphidinium_carterae.1
MFPNSIWRSEEEEQRPREGFLIPLVPSAPRVGGGTGPACTDGQSSGQECANTLTVGSADAVGKIAGSRSDCLQAAEKRRRDEIVVRNLGRGSHRQAYFRLPCPFVCLYYTVVGQDLGEDSSHGER